MAAQNKLPRPKHFEKVLLVNHKEEQSLQDRLDRLQVSSRVREIELDREKSKVRNELRNSRKRQIPIDSQPAVSVSRLETQRSAAKVMFSAITTIRPRTANEASSNGQGKKDDGVNTYLLGEYRRMSEVIPTILSALSAKDEKKQKAKEKNYQRDVSTQSSGVYTDWQDPDLHKIRKVVTAIKTLRHNMAINKKLEYTRPNVSLSQRFKELRNKEHSEFEIDQYTDGACVLLKRKIDKRRRGSLPDAPSSMKRRHSSVDLETADKQNMSSRTPRSASVSIENYGSRHRHSISLPALQRSASVLQFGKPLARSNSSLSMLNRQKAESPDFKSQFMDEDELLLRKRVNLELNKYELLKERVDKFLVYRKPIVETYDKILAS